MKVIITSTPNYSTKELQEVIQLLDENSGPISFELGEPMSENQFDRITKKYWKNPQQNIFSFDEMFELISEYRTIRDISDNEYVAMITPLNNYKNWFSVFRENDLFVDSKDWEYYSKRDSKYGIAFQIVENLIQKLMKLNVDDPQNEPNIHFNTEGCINMFCENKTDIMIKFRTGFICESCEERIISELEDATIYFQLRDIIDYLRDKMVKSFRQNNLQQTVESLTVNADGEIKIGHKNIELFPQQKSVYFLFLNNIDGISNQNLDDFTNETLSLYKKIMRTEYVDENVILNVFKKNYNLQYTTFQSKKSEINKSFIINLGKINSENYIIEYDRQEKTYKLKIDKKYIKINEKFLTS